LTTRDIRTSIKSTGEKIAKSAIEYGVYQLVLNIDNQNGNTAYDYTLAKTQISTTTYYQITAQTPAALATKPAFRALSGNSLGFSNLVFNERVIGSDTRYGSQLTVDVGIEYYSPKPTNTTSY
jgi:hypothetical protein